MRIGLILLGLAVTFAIPAAAQTPSRAQVLAGEFTKFKHETRAKKGVSHTKYKEVISEAWVVLPSAYAGHYRSEEPMYLDITVDASGRATGSGRDEGRFELRDLTISRGLISGRKVYADGRDEEFEAVFLKRASREAAGAEFFVSYGIGVLAEEIRIFAARR